MRYRDCFQRIGLPVILLTAGMLGGLIAPPPSIAQSLPIVTIYEVVSGVTHTTIFNVVLGGTNCTSSPAPPTGFVCYSLPEVTTVPMLAAGSRWRVSSVSSSNRARVLVKDSDTAPDNMYITGISIQSNINATSTTNTVTTPCSLCQTGHMTLQKLFNAGNGNAAGTFNWAVHMGGNFNAPDFSENVINDRMRVTARACLGSTCNIDSGTIVGTLDTTPTSSPTTSGGQGSLTRDTGPTAFGTCNTGNSKCKQTVKYDYEFTVQGLDQVNLTDSVTGCGGTCNPGLKAKGQLPACGGTDANGVPTPPLPGEQPSFLYQCLQQLADDSTADETSNLATGGVPAEVCGTPACIGIIVEGTPPGTSAFVGPFTIETSGTGMDCDGWTRVVEVVNPETGLPEPKIVSTPCQIWLDRDGNGTRTFSNLQLDPPAGDRTITFTGFPDGGAQGLYQLDQVTSQSTNCTFQVITSRNGNNKTKLGTTVTSLQAGHCLLELHVH